MMSITGKKASEWYQFGCTLGIKRVSIMDMLNWNSMTYHFIYRIFRLRKTVLNRDSGLSTYITK